jgi:glycosyl transferase, family 25
MSQNIDKTFYINLRKRSDRREQIEKQLNEFNLEYERFEAIETPGFGTFGCCQSHLSVLKIAKERGYKNVLIFEDDFEFCVTKEVFEINLVGFFDQYPNFDVCFLSYNLREYQEIENSFVNKIVFSQTASGYIINSHYYDKLINLYEWAAPLLDETKQHWIYSNDIVWRDLQKTDNWYYFKERIGKQSDGWSDNVQGFVCYKDC